MKKYSFILVATFIFSVISCKKTINNKLENIINVNEKDAIADVLKKTVKSSNKDTLLIGDYLISKKNFVDKINTTCVSEEELAISDSYKKKCVYYKIKFLYEDINYIDENTIQSFNGISYSLKKSNESSDADDFAIKNLIIKKDDVLTDSIRIYSYESYIEALAQKNEYYYLKDNHLWILKFNIDEDGIKVVNWKNYKINDDGKIVLI